MSKITKATIKSFIKKNFDDLYISTRSRFNGMIDCVDACQDQSFRKVEIDARERFYDKSLGIKDALFDKFSKTPLVKIHLLNLI